MAIRTTPSLDKEGMKWDINEPSGSNLPSPFPSVSRNPSSNRAQTTGATGAPVIRDRPWYEDKYGNYAWELPEFPMGTRPILPNDNEGVDLSGVGKSPIAPPPPVLPPSDNRLVISQAPLRPVKESDYITKRPDSGGAYNFPTIGVRPVTLPPMPPPPLPPSPPVNVCLPPPTFRCPC